MSRGSHPPGPICLLGRLEAFRPTLRRLALRDGAIDAEEDAALAEYDEMLHAGEVVAARFTVGMAWLRDDEEPHGRLIRLVRDWQETYGEAPPEAA